MKTTSETFNSKHKFHSTFIIYYYGKEYFYNATKVFPKKNKHYKDCVPQYTMGKFRGVSAHPLISFCWSLG